MSGYLDFRDISQRIGFKDVLNWLCVPYQEKKDELRANIGDLLFIINTQKNTFFCPKNDTLKGGIINFASYCLKIDLRSAATELSRQFLLEPKQPIRELPKLELLYCKYLEDKGISVDTALRFEVGFVKQKSIITGRIAFKIYDHQGKHTGYIGYHQEKGWFFPAGFQRPLYNYYLLKDEPNIFLTSDPFECLKLNQEGFPCCSLLGKSMTDVQEKVLTQFSSITLIHPEPANIATRIYPHTFFRAKPYNSNSAE